MMEGLLAGLGLASLVTQQLLRWLAGWGAVGKDSSRNRRDAGTPGRSGMIDAAEMGVLRNSVLHSFVLCHIDTATC